MPFSPPGFEQLCRSSFQLENTFSAIARRYKSQNLDELLRDVHEQMLNSNQYRPQSDRRSKQLDVFRKIYNELIDTPSSATEKQNNEAKMFFLGGLIHRYLRLQMEYEKRIDSKVLSFFGSRVENCNLYKQLLKVLKISDENPLDALTIQTCCQSFYDNMAADNRYLNYAHFHADPDFLYNLQTLIEHYKPLAAPMLFQLQAISFLESLAQALEQINESIDKASIQLIHEELKDKDFNELTLETLVDQLNASNMEAHTKVRIEQLLSTPYVSKTIGQGSADDLLKSIRLSLQARNQYALLGGYLLIFERFKSDNDIRKALKMALWPDAMPKNAYIEPNTHFNALSMLSKWVLDIDQPYNLDCSTWSGDIERLKAAVIEQKAMLMASSEEGADETETFSHAV